MNVETIKQVIRYGIKGGAFVALNVTIQIVLVELNGLRPEIAAALSTAAMPFLGYIVMNRFVFPESGAAETRLGYIKRFAQYYGVNMSSKVINYILFLGFLHVGIWYPVAYTVAAAIVFVGAFTVNRRIWFGAVNT